MLHHSDVGRPPSQRTRRFQIIALLHSVTRRPFAIFGSCGFGDYLGRWVGSDGQPTNNIENFLGNFERGMRGVYRKCEAQHSQRYVAEFEFRFNRQSALGVNDMMRAEDLLKGAEGKRLTYRSPNEDHP